MIMTSLTPRDHLTSSHPIPRDSPAINVVYYFPSTSLYLLIISACPSIIFVGPSKFFYLLIITI